MKTYNSLKKEVFNAIKKGNNTTRMIIAYCDAELRYREFCKALAELQIEGKIIYNANGYVLA